MKQIITKIILWLTIIIVIMLLLMKVTTAQSKNVFIGLLLNNQMLSGNSVQASVSIKSDTYIISELYSYIARVLPKTTVKEFKEKFNISASEIKVFSDETLEREVTSGYIKTGMAVKFNAENKVYTISVIGDLNGDGLSTQIEIQSLIKYIVNPTGYPITGINAISADVNQDESINQIDLNLLINYIVFGKLDIGELKTAEKPSIEVISGEKNEEGIYITDITLKITPKQAENVEKTTYSISGAIEVEETEIPENGEIVLNQNGAYIIKSYTYLKDGSKSDPAELSISKSIEGIKDESIGLILKLNDKQGEDYISGEWTKENVYIETIEKVEEISNNLSIKINTKYTITKKIEGIEYPQSTDSLREQPMTINSEGEYVITAVATDELGRTKTKEYIAKIDKTQPEGATINIQENKQPSGYYNQVVNLTINKGQDSMSGIGNITYELLGSETKEETIVSEGQNIQITEDGETEIKIKIYDNAGNYAEISELFKIDKTAPNDITLNVTDMTTTSFKLNATAKDNLSGIKKYEFYLDDNICEAKETSEEFASCEITKVTSEKHIAKVKVTDNASNTNEYSIEVSTLKLTQDEIKSIRFEISELNLVNGENYAGIDKIISDTTLGKENKYIQLSINNEAPEGTTAELIGNVKIIRKDGVEVSNVEFFPEDMEIQVSYSAEGSGKNYKHKSTCELLSTAINENNEELTEEIANRTKTIKIKDILANNEEATNNLKISEKKIKGANCITRVVINSISIGENDFDFEIVNKIQ